MAEICLGLSGSAKATLYQVMYVCIHVSDIHVILYRYIHMYSVTNPEKIPSFNLPPLLSSLVIKHGLLEPTYLYHRCMSLPEGHLLNPLGKHVIYQFATVFTTSLQSIPELIETSFPILYRFYMYIYIYIHIYIYIISEHLPFYFFLGVAFKLL